MAVIIPEVFAVGVNKAMTSALRAGRIATDYTELVDDIRYCGNKVHFPVIDRISGASVLSDGGTVTFQRVSMTDNAATIKHVTNGVEILDRENVQVKAALKDAMAKQLGESLAQAVDSDIVSEILTNATYVDTTNSLNNAVVENAFVCFGDQRDAASMAGILINSRLAPHFMNMDGFVSATRTNTTSGNGVVVDGVLGYYSTIPVILSDNGTYTFTAGQNGGADSSVAEMIIVKKGAVGVVWQKEPTIEEARDIDKLGTKIAAQTLYAVKAVDLAGVSVLHVNL